MEVDEHHVFKSNFGALVQQVDEQSEFCDITVKIGDWKKKFHRCVLSTSLLFQIILDIHIKEAEQCAGVQIDTTSDYHIEMSFETSTDIFEMAIMYMYGRLPRFNMENISFLLDIAEYIMFKELKDACINWLNGLDYSKVNCMYVIQLSTKYDFDVLSCTEYIESHIPEILLNDEAIDLSYETVDFLFINEMFWYVETIDKFNFLVKWVSKHPSNLNNDIIIELSKKLGLNEEIKHTLMNNTVSTVSKCNIENVIRQSEKEDSTKRLIMLISAEDYIACLDLKSDRWYRLNSEINHVNINGLRNDTPEVYFIQNTFFGGNVSTFDLETNQIRQYELQLDFIDVEDGDIVDVEIMNVIVKNDTVVALVKTEIQEFENDNSSGGESNLVETSPERITVDSTIDGLCTGEILNVSIKRQTTYSSLSDARQDVNKILTTIYVGNVSGDFVEMNPIFTLREGEIIKMCMNNQSALVLLTKSNGFMHVILFDMLHFKMERTLSLQEGKYEVCSTEKGFLLHDDTRCYCFAKLAVPFFSKTYKVENFMLANKVGWQVNYRYQEGFWIRTLRRSTDPDIKLQYISHEEFLVSNSLLDEYWENLSIPEDSAVVDMIKDIENIFIATLSKRKLRCNIACPHCKFSRDARYFLPWNARH